METQFHMFLFALLPIGWEFSWANEKTERLTTTVQAVVQILRPYYCQSDTANLIFNQNLPPTR